MAFTEDLSAFFQDSDFAVTAIHNGVSGKVLLDIADQVTGESGRLISTEYKITFPTSLYPSLAYKNSVTVDSIAYTVNHVEKTSDGKISYAFLTKV